MTQRKFIKFLIGLGYSEEDIVPNLREDTFSYLKPIVANEYYENDISIKYIYIPIERFEAELFEKHADLWNENKEHVFIVVSERTTHLINAKVKPDPNTPLHKNTTIDNFSYGINSKDFDPEELKRLRDTLGKESIDSAYFFDFVVKKTKHQKINEVDKDLLLNLIQLRNDLLQTANTQETIHLLLLRCLFIKFLEDRGIYDKNYIANILKTGSPQKLVDAFVQIKRINGDIFKYDEFSLHDIHEEYLGKLELFFSCFDYRTKQGSLFPYNFSRIPVQLISNVYEAFLSNSHKGNKGIYYTPAFVVQFMLAHTVKQKLQENRNATVLDPACGSGAFLVEAFKEIVKYNDADNDYEKKVAILKNQIFGIDIDKQALQIATFSLYLSLLAGEEPKDIQEKIKNAYPILPSLINHTLTRGNSLIEDIYPDTTFDCIVANPPWGSVEQTGDDEDKRERIAISQKGKIGVLTNERGEPVEYPEYKNVSDYQRSQAFLLRINRWCQNGTVCALIVNNPIFLNENAEDFRKELLTQYRIAYFYELSHLNKILFKKRVIGKIKANGKDESIEIGASEPCAIITFDKKELYHNEIQYISPQLTRFSEAFEFIHYTTKDIRIIKQEDFLKEDYWLWKIFVNGSWPDYQLIKQKYIERDRNLVLACRSGFQPKRGGKSQGKPRNRLLITQSDFEQYYIKRQLGTFNWNRKLRRDPEKKLPNIFKGKRILFPMRPLKSDKFRLRGIRVNGDIVHKHNILRFEINEGSTSIEDYAPYLAILNSSLLGYFIFHISSQWGKGEEKRSALRNSDIENLPFPVLQGADREVHLLTSLVEQIEIYKEEGKDTLQLEREIDELVFDLYGLLEFEKELIREFYQINVERESDLVTKYDLQKYVDKFRQVFSFILADHIALNATYRISSNIGTYIRFSIVKKERIISKLQQECTEDSQILEIVKKKQLNQAFFSHKLNEDKVKVYDENKFFIVKSNYFKDWTVRQAMDDANEEIGLIMRELPEE